MFITHIRSTSLLGFVAAFLGAAILPSPPTHGQEDTSVAINHIVQVGPNGDGHEAAVDGIKTLNQLSIDAVPEILAGMNRAENKLAVNWLRSAIVSIVDRGGELPAEKIQTYFDNQENSHLGRLMAFELLDEHDSNWSDKTIPTLLDDPSMPLREKAISMWIDRSQEASFQESVGYLSAALSKARDVNQIVTIAKLLRGKGIEINLQRQLGFITAWNLVGTFDNRKEAGFNVPYGPELAVNKIDLESKYKDMNGEVAGWKPHRTHDPMGLVDLTEAVGKIKGATVYAYTVFDATEARDAELRIGSSNAHKVWLNGELIVANEVYHNGTETDKFSGQINLKEGENQILIKVCQNEMTDSWAQRWDFMFRICDETGRAILPAEPVSQ